MPFVEKTSLRADIHNQMDIQRRTEKYNNIHRSSDDSCYIVHRTRGK